MTQQNIDNNFVNNKNFTMKNFIDKICARRLSIINKLGIELNKYINRFKYKYKVDLEITEFINPNNNQLVSFFETTNNPLDILYNKYQQKIDSDITTETDTKNVKHIFLKYMNDLVNYMPYNIRINKNDELKYSDFIESNYIIRNDTNGNIILNYILDEFINLLESDNNPSEKIINNNTCPHCNKKFFQKS
jgi:hypothetical protein